MIAYSIVVVVLHNSTEPCIFTPLGTVHKFQWKGGWQNIYRGGVTGF